MINHGFIFARGGSKGLPRKNVKLLCGKPLIQYSIETAQSTPEISMVFVSTDDQEIATIARRLGAVVIERPIELAGDKSPEWLAWRHAIEWVNKNYGVFDLFTSLPVTSPLRDVSDVQSAIKQKIQTNADICISVTEASRSPYFNMVKEIGGFVDLVNSNLKNINCRQDVPVVYDITTVVYTANPEYILQSDGLFSGSVVKIIVPKERSVDIDDIYDFMFAECLLNKDSTNVK